MEARADTNQKKDEMTILIRQNRFQSKEYY